MLRVTVFDGQPSEVGSRELGSCEVSDIPNEPLEIEMTGYPARFATLGAPGAAPRVTVELRPAVYGPLLRILPNAWG